MLCTHTSVLFSVNRQWVCCAHCVTTHSLATLNYYTCKCSQQEQWEEQALASATQSNQSLQTTCRARITYMYYTQLMITRCSNTIMTTYRWHFMSLRPPLKYPNLSAGLSLHQYQEIAISIYTHHVYTSTCIHINVEIYLHSFLMRFCAHLLIRFGNSITSIPFKIMLQVLIGSAPQKGGLEKIDVHQSKKAQGAMSPTLLFIYLMSYM